MAIPNALTPKFQIFQKMDLIVLCSEWLIWCTLLVRKLTFFALKLQKSIFHPAFNLRLKKPN